MAKPKLALIPAAQGTKFYSVLPSDGSGDFDFTRGSVATRINAQGLIENVASGQSRLDYPLIDGVQKGCPHHILEPARTNLLTHSEGFITDWNNTNITINSNSIISPDGSLNGTKFIPNTTSSGHYLDRNGITVNSNATASIFAKKGEYKRFAIRSYFTGANAIFDVNEGIIVSASSVTAKIEDYGNGWYRCSLNETLNASYGYGIFVMEDDSINPLYAYSGNGVDGMYFYGASLEIGSFISSYIPTTTTAVTRSAETASGAGNSTTFNDSEGVFMVETSFVNDTSFKGISISSGANGNAIRIYSSLADNQLVFRVTVNSVDQVLKLYTLSDTSLYNKISLKYKENDFSVFINGFKLLTDDSGSTFSNGVLNQLNFNRSDGNDPFYGKAKQVQYFDSALADTQLEQLTSWQSFRDMANGQLYTIE